MEYIKMDVPLKAIPSLPAETCIQHDTSIALDKARNDPCFGGY